MANKILIIEDDHCIRELIQEILTEEGHSVRAAENGLFGLQELEHRPLPNLIFVDLMMPIMDGYSFLAQKLSREDWKQIPVVVMSAEAGAKDKIRPYQVSHFLAKPMNLDELINVVSELLN